MARIIDKEEKRCDIARASIDLFCEKGIQQTSIDEIAKSAGVAKGTVYLYFKNKEEIVFAIWDILAERHFESLIQRIVPTMSAKEKILTYYDFSSCFEESEHQKMLDLLQHFTSTMLIDQSGLYTSYFESFFQRDYDFIFLCLEEGIQSEQMQISDTHTFANSIILVSKGLIMMAKAKNYDFTTTQTLLKEHISYLLDLHVRKEK